MSREYKWKSTTGNGYDYLIRRALENKKYFVLEVYMNGNKYPNIISGQYRTLKACKDAMSLYQTTGKIPWGNVNT